MNYRTEDEVRDSAKLILGFDKTEPKVKQRTGQITTFNQLGFKGVIDKPDGWYLPDDKGIPAIILDKRLIIQTFLRGGGINNDLVKNVSTKFDIFIFPLLSFV